MQKNYKTQKENVYLIENKYERYRNAMNLKTFYRRKMIFGDVIKYKITDKIILQVVDLENINARENYNYSVKLYDETIVPFSSVLIFKKIDNDVFTIEEIKMLNDRITFLK